MAAATPKPFTFRAVVVKIIDGDTLTVDLDLGFDLWKRNASVRLHGCNCIELKDPGGIAARDFLIALVPAGTALVLVSKGLDKYGRADAELWLTDAKGVVQADGNVKDRLVAAGYAVNWNGNGVRPVPAWPLVA